MSFHRFITDEGKKHGYFEVFEVTDLPAPASVSVARRPDDLEPGWYWWPCWPTCLPDGPAQGPFVSEAEALAAALG